MKSTKLKCNNKLLLVLLLVMGVVSATAIWAGFGRQHSVASEPPKIAGVYLPAARTNIQPFHLADTKGKPFTRDSLKGQWTMMFFGFTNCGMVCPTTLSALNKMYRQLQETLPDKFLPHVVMVTVDPERDTLSRMRGYLGTFNKNFTGARAEISETVALEKQLNIAAAKIQADGSGKNHYTIDHSAEILLFNPEGGLQAYLSWPHEAKTMADDYRAILNAAATTEPLLHDTDGHILRMSDLRDKWVILNYWAPWCEGCRQELPELNRFHDSNHDSNVLLLGASYDQPGKTELVKLVSTMHMTFPSLLENPGRIWPIRAPEVLPVTYIIAPGGKLHLTLTGPQTAESLASALADFRKHAS